MRRYGALGVWFALWMLGFAVTRLTIDVWRPGTPDRGPLLAFVLGVAPNLASAPTLPALGMMCRECLELSATDRRCTRYDAWDRASTGAALIGLIAWELPQRRGGLAFDPFDVAATLLGAGLAYAGVAFGRRRLDEPIVPDRRTFAQTMARFRTALPPRRRRGRRRRRVTSRSSSRGRAGAAPPGRPGAARAW